MEYCRIRISEFKKSLKFDHLKTGKILEKINQNYCKNVKYLCPYQRSQLI